MSAIAWRSTNGTSLPITAADWSTRLSSDGRRSIRAARTVWMVAGTWMPSMGLVGAIGAAFADQDPGLDERPHALLQEERIALGPRNQEPREGLELNVGPEQRLEQLAGARRRQRVDPDLRVVCPAAPGMLVFGAGVHEEQEAGDRHAGHEAVEKGLALTVHPGKVLEDQQQRLYLALPQQQALPGLECAPSALRRG